MHASSTPSSSADIHDRRQRIQPGKTHIKHSTLPKKSTHNFWCFLINSNSYVVYGLKVRVPGRVATDGRVGTIPAGFICIGLSHDKQAKRNGFLTPAASSPDLSWEDCVVGRPFTWSNFFSVMNWFQH